jgi:hypothetical protein
MAYRELRLCTLGWCSCWDISGGIVCCLDNTSGSSIFEALRFRMLSVCDFLEEAYMASFGVDGLNLLKSLFQNIL